MRFLRGFTPTSRRLFSTHARNNLFVGGLCYDTNEPVLREAFGRYGEIIDVRVICHRFSGKSRGYGFVKFTSEAAASLAIKEMHDQLLDGRNIRVEYAKNVSSC